MMATQHYFRIPNAELHTSQKVVLYYVPVVPDVSEWVLFQLVMSEPVSVGSTLWLAIMRDYSACHSMNIVFHLVPPQNHEGCLLRLRRTL
jgi:hypothetical protein